MMFDHYYHNQKQAAERQKSLRREAERERLLSAMRAGQVRWHTRLLANLGDTLIASGTWLKVRYTARRSSVVLPELSFIRKD